MLARLPGIERPLGLAVAQDGDPVGDLEDLGETMAHVDHTYAAPPAGGDGAVERLDLVRPESGGGLVEEQHLGVGDQRLGHLEELSLGEREKPRGRIREELEIQVELPQEPARPLLPPPERRPLVGWGGQVEVVLDRLGQDQRGVLVGHGKAKLACQCRRVGPQELAPDADRPRVGLDEPAGDPEESRLTRAVLADEGMHLAGTAVEADIGQRPDRPELAGDPAQFEDDVRGRLLDRLGSTHPSGYIRASTSSGTRDVPETVGVTRSGSQSSWVT